MKNEVIALTFLLVGVLTLSYSTIDAFLIKSFNDFEEGFVERIVDGDTIVVNSEKVRLLGINSPEKGEVNSELGKEFLTNEILGKRVRLYFGKEKYDMYKRKLAYVFLGDTNINLESVKRGYSNYYFPTGSERFSSEIKEAWNECLKNNINICEASKNKCIKLEELDIENQEITIRNSCNYDINLKDWSIKDEGRKKFIFDDEIMIAYTNRTLTNNDWGKDYVWTKSGDSVFIRDEYSKLVLFYSY